MRTLRLCVGEVATGLGLLVVAYLYLQIQSDPGILFPLQVKAVLIAVYVIIASASEALIASRLQSVGWQVPSLNAILVVPIAILYVVNLASMRFVTTLAILTVLFRVLVAVVSLRVPPQKLHRFVSALVGGPLLLAAFGLGYVFVVNMYQNYFLFPRIKAGFTEPTRWQDFVFLFISASGSIALLFISHRLLKYATRPKSVPATQASGVSS